MTENIMEGGLFYVCRCFYTNNYFTKKLNSHLSYYDNPSFLRENEQILSGLDQDEVDSILKEFEKEKERRENLGKAYLERRAAVHSGYTPRHPHVYKLKEQFLDPRFLQLVEDCRQNTQDVPSVSQTKAERVYSLPVFTPQFCHDLVEELEHFEASAFPKGRPNTMNNCGILLDEVGLDIDLLTPLCQRYLAPLTSALFPECGGKSLDSQKAFTVTYRTQPGSDQDLAYHYDNAEVTVNVSLTSCFDDGYLYFGPMRTEPQSKYTKVEHKLGYGLLHRGQHMHGAMPITDGVRHNLILWMRSSEVRNRLCPMCDRTPELVETVGFGDGFTKPTVDVCSVV